MHLIVDGFGGDPARLQNAALIHHFLDTYPAAIGMTKIAPAKVFTYIGVKSEDWGVSGFVIIAESHISIHTFPERSYVNIDVFSCKEFDAEAVAADVQELFQFDRTEWRVLHRGLEYPHNLTPALRTAREERLQVAAATVKVTGHE